MFITLEGIEGVGKSTQLKFLASELQSKGISLLVTREPGGTPMGEEIRDILLAHRNERVAPMTELLLMFAARAQHVDTVIQPALKQGKWVLCDRFTDATYAYQGGGRGVPMQEIENLEKFVLNKFHPDLTIILDAPVEIGQQRMQNRSNHVDRFEKEKLEFFERVRKVYLQRAALFPGRYKVIDASLSVSAVQSEIIKIIKTLLN